jgi:hypothetical protein
VDGSLVAFLAPAQGADELGRLGPYRVLSVLGAGGMGVVYKAHDPALDRLAAVKAMLPGLGSSPPARERFLREARAAAAVQHEHVVTIYQVGEDRGAPFLAMEFLQGESLEDRLRRCGPLPAADVLRIGREAAEGLHAAHERGLIHRDVKPANIWLEGCKGRVKILDFGLARVAAQETHLTQEGVIMGTPAYMAPEQVRGEAVDRRCDLFSLGVVLYQMCTGKPPFHGPDVPALLLAVAFDRAEPPCEVRPGIPDALSALVMRLLCKDPADRPASAEAVAAALAEMERHPSTLPVPVPPHDAQAPAPVKRGRAGPAAGVAVALALGAAAGLVLAFWPRVGKTDPAAVAPEPGGLPPGFVPLFNGKDLSGWSVAQGRRKDWRAGGGVLACAASQPGWLKSERQYGDFVLRLSWRLLTPDGNSGVYLRVPPGRGDPAQRGATEVEIVNDARPRLPALQRAGALYGVLAPSRPVFKRVGAWHTFEITCTGSRIEVVADDEPVVDAVGLKALAGRPGKGYLGLQGWEGRVEFRDIAVRDLSPSAAPPGPPPLPPARVLARVCAPRTRFHVALSPDGQALAAGGLDRKLRFFDLQRPGEPAVLTGRAVNAIGFAEGGRVATAESWPPALRVYDARTRKAWSVAPRLHTRNLRFALSGDGRYLADAVKDRKVVLWDLARREARATLTGATGEVRMLAVSPGGRFVAARVRPEGTGPHGLLIWETDRPAHPRRLDVGGARGLIAFTPDGTALHDVAGAWVRTLRAPTFEPRGWRRLEISPTGPAALSADGRSIVGLADAAGTLAVCDLATGKRGPRLQARGEVYDVAVTRDGRTAAAACDDGGVRLWQLPPAP